MTLAIFSVCADSIIFCNYRTKVGNQSSAKSRVVIESYPNKVQFKETIYEEFRGR